MTTGRINQVTSPYKLNKRRDDHQMLSKEKMTAPRLKNDFPASLLARRHRAFGKRFELTRFLKLKHTFSNKVSSESRARTEAHTKPEQSLILVVYLNRSLVAEIITPKTISLNSTRCDTGDKLWSDATTVQGRNTVACSAPALGHLQMC